MTTTVIDEVGSILKSALIQTEGPAVLAFLQAIQKTPTAVGEAAAWFTLQGATLSAGPELVSLLAGLVASRVQALIAANPASPA